MHFSLVDVTKNLNGVRYDYVFYLKKLFRRTYYKLSFVGDNPYVWFDDIWDDLKRHTISEGYLLEDLIERQRPIQISIGTVEFTALSPTDIKRFTGSKSRQKELLNKAVEKTMFIRKELEETKGDNVRN